MIGPTERPATLGYLRGDGHPVGCPSDALRVARSHARLLRGARLPPTRAAALRRRETLNRANPSEWRRPRGLVSHRVVRLLAGQWSALVRRNLLAPRGSLCPSVSNPGGWPTGDNAGPRFDLASVSLSNGWLSRYSGGAFQVVCRVSPYPSEEGCRRPLPLPVGLVRRAARAQCIGCANPLGPTTQTPCRSFLQSVGFAFGAKVR